MDWLEKFVRESNRIEGILREPTEDELRISVMFLALPNPNVEDMKELVSVYQPGAVLRERDGLNVCVGRYIAPPGGPEIARKLETIVNWAKAAPNPYLLHQEYEHLHPFTDGNGRSGRMLWLHCMRRHHEDYDAPLGFLHAWYYQSLENWRRP